MIRRHLVIRWMVGVGKGKSLTFYVKLVPEPFTHWLLIQVKRGCNQLTGDPSYFLCRFLPLEILLRSQSKLAEPSKVI